MALGEATRIGSATAFGVSEDIPIGLASIGNTLYMVGDINDALYTLNTSTGIATRVGSATNFGVNEDQPSGLASIGNTLYMIGRTTDALYTLNTSTGIATRVGSATQFGVNEASPSGLGAIGSTLYMLGDRTNALYTLNTATGRATRVGTSFRFGVSEHAPTGLASIGSTLYMVGQANDALYTLNTSTGIATRVGSATNFGVNEASPEALAAIGDTLYMVGRDNDVLYTLQYFEPNVDATFTGAAGLKTGDFDIGVDFSGDQEINGFELADINIARESGATIADAGLADYTLSGPTTGTNNFTISFTPLPDVQGTFSVDIDGMLTISGPTFSGTRSVPVDITPVQITYDTRLVATFGSPTSTRGHFTIRLDFDTTEAITNFNRDNISVSQTHDGYYDYVIEQISGDNNSFILSFTPDYRSLTSDGSIQINVSGSVTEGSTSRTIKPVSSPSITYHEEEGIRANLTALTGLQTGNIQVSGGVDAQAVGVGRSIDHTDTLIGFDRNDIRIEHVSGTALADSGLQDFTMDLRDGGTDGPVALFDINFTPTPGASGMFEVFVNGSANWQGSGIANTEIVSSPILISYNTGGIIATWTVPDTEQTGATTSARIDFGAVVSGFTASDVSVNGSAGVTVNRIASAGSQQVWDIFLDIAEGTDADITLSIAAGAVTRTPAQPLLTSPSFSVDREVEPITATFSGLDEILRTDFSVRVDFAGTEAVSDFLANDIQLTRTGGALIANAGISDFTITPVSGDNNSFNLNFTPAENIEYGGFIDIIGNVTVGGISRSVSVNSAIMSIDTRFPAVSAVFSGQTGVKSSGFEIGVVFEGGTDAVTGVTTGDFELLHISGAELDAATLDMFTVHADNNNNRRYILDFPLVDNVTGTFQLDFASDALVTIDGDSHNVVSNEVQITYDSRVGSIAGNIVVPSGTQTDIEGWSARVDFPGNLAITEFNTANLDLDLTGDSPFSSAFEDPVITPVEGDNNSFNIMFIPARGGSGGLGGGTSGTIEIDLQGEVLQAGLRRNITALQQTIPYNVAKFITASISDVQTTQTAPFILRVTFGGRFRVTDFDIADVDIARISGSSLRDAGLRENDIDISRVGDTTFDLSFPLRPHVTGRITVALEGSVSVTGFGTNMILADTVSLDYNSVPEITGRPLLRTIPTTMLKPGESVNFALDEYASGDVATVSLSNIIPASATWITLSGAASDGINRTLRIAPPANLAVSGASDVYTFDVTATSPAGMGETARTASVEVFVYVERLDPAEQISIVDWDIPEEDMGKITTATTTLGVIFSRPLMTGETLLMSDIRLEGVEGVTVASVGIDADNNRRYNVVLAISQGASGILNISVI